MEQDQEGSLSKPDTDGGITFGGIFVPRYVVPFDEDDAHYVKSFKPWGEEEPIKRFFEAFGFVVIRDVFNSTRM